MAKSATAKVIRLKPGPKTDRAATPVIKVDDNIPMPGRSAYPHTTMKVGQSFEIPAEVKASLSANIRAHGQRFGKRFAFRGNRVWRVA